MDKYIVQIVGERGKVVKEFNPCGSLGQAERLERGVQINLNPALRTRIVVKKGKVQK